MQEMEYSEPKIVLDEAEIPIKRVFAPNLDVDQPKKYIAYQGAQSVVWQRIGATSTSNSQLVWQINTPSVRTGISRQMFVEITVDVTALDGVGGVLQDNDYNTVLDGRLGLNLFPLHSASDTASLDLNSSRFSWRPRSLISALNTYNIPKEVQDTVFSSTGSMPDKFSTLNIDNTVAGDREVVVTALDVRNPVGTYDINSAQQTRNVSNYTITFPGAANSGRFQVKFLEPLLLPPLKAGARDYPCLYGINNFNLNYVMGDLQRMFKAKMVVANPNIFNQLGAINITEALLHVQYYTFNLQYKLPKTPVWSCMDITNFTTTIGTINDPADEGVQQRSKWGSVAVNKTTNNINLNQIPKSIYVFATRRVGADTASAPDTWLRMTQISVDFNNRSGLLSTMREFDLYQLSRKNGLKMSYKEVTECGLPLCLNVAEDLSLGDDQAPGLIGQFNLQFNLNFQTPESFPRADVTAGRIPIINDFDVNVVVVNEGACWLGPDGILKTKFGMLTENAILSAPIEYGTYETYMQDTLYGGNFFDKVASFVKKGAKAVGKFAPHVASITGALAPLAAQSSNPKLQQLSRGLSTVSHHAPTVGAYADMLSGREGAGGARYVSKKELRRKLRK